MAECILLSKGSLINVIKKFPSECIDINMLYVGYTNGPALFTYGANPCMAVVVHYKKKNCGFMAHIAMKGISEGLKGLFMIVHFHIVNMIFKIDGFSKDYDQLQVFLFGSTLLADYPKENFPRYLAKTMPKIDLIDKLDYPPLLRTKSYIERIPAQVLYWPEENIVAELNTKELEYLQKNQKKSLYGVSVKIY